VNALMLECVVHGQNEGKVYLDINRHPITLDQRSPTQRVLVIYGWGSPLHPSGTVKEYAELPQGLYVDKENGPFYFLRTIVPADDWKYVERMERLLTTHAKMNRPRYDPQFAKELDEFVNTLSIDDPTAHERYEEVMKAWHDISEAKDKEDEEHA
jgi:hypothetical protein